MSVETVEVQFPAGRRLRVLAHRAVMHNFAEHERATLERLASAVRPGMVVYDVGAEEGEFSAFAASMVGGEGVHLFEPVPAIWPNIRAVWEANGFAGPGGCWPGFLADRASGHSVSRVVRGWPRESEGPIRDVSGFAVVHQRPDLPSLSLDDYARLSGTTPDVIMMDVEGAEVLVIAGASEVLRTSRPLVFLSLHPTEFLAEYRLDGAPCTQEMLWTMLDDAGYVAEHIETDHEAHWLFTPRP